MVYSGFDKALMQSLLVGGVGWLSYHVALATAGKQAAKMIKAAAILSVVTIAAPALLDGITSVRDTVNNTAATLTGYADRFLAIVEAPGQTAEGVKDFLTRHPDQEAGREAIEKFLLEAPDKEKFWAALRKFLLESPKEWR